MTYAIKMDTGDNYFRGWANGHVTTRRGERRGVPAFGATRETAARYATREEAWAQIDAMPMQAGVMCDVVEIEEPTDGE